MKKSSIVQRGKASSTWRNNTPPNKKNVSTVRMTVPVAVTIPVGKILIGAILLLIIWGML